MALINFGSINDFAVSAKESVIKENPFLKGINTISKLNEFSRVNTRDSLLHSNSSESLFEYVTSKEQRGLALKSIMLTEGHDGLLDKILNTTNEIYFFAWAWDLSGMPVNVYPGQNTKSQDVIIPMKVGSVRKFIGQGINLFPKRFVKGGIEIRIQIWESDKEMRNFGKAMK